MYSEIISRNELLNKSRKTKTQFNMISKLLKQYIIITALGLGILIVVVLNIEFIGRVIFYSPNAMHIPIPSSLLGFLLLIFLVIAFMVLFVSSILIEHNYYKSILNLVDITENSILGNSGKELLKGYKFQIRFFASVIIFLINSSFLPNLHYSIYTRFGVDLYFGSLILFGVISLSILGVSEYFHIKGYFTLSNWTALIKENDVITKNEIENLNIGTKLAKKGSILNCFVPGVGLVLKFIGLWKIKNAFNLFGSNLPTISQEIQS